MTTRITLTIDVDYMPSWGVYEGLRELIQNWLDEADDAKTPGGVETEWGDTVVRLVNPGGHIPRKALLLGNTTKRDRDDQRGQFGEGLKLGALALVRAGKRVTVEAGGERWTFTIEPSPDFADRRVLVCAIEPSEAPGVVVEVDDLGPGEWEAAISAFRQLAPVEAVETYSGSLFLDPDLSGVVYVKGIRVTKEKDLVWGYDFPHADVDRDRRLIRAWQMQYHAGGILAEALIAGTLAPDAALAELERGAVDFGEFPTYHANDTNRALLAEAWRAKYGDAIPVKDAADAQRLDHLGKPSRIVHSLCVATLSPVLGTVEEIVRAAFRDAIAVHPVETLTATERASLAWALAEVEAVVGTAPTVTIATFRDDGTLGRFIGGRIEIARKVLSDRFETLATLIHEVAHFVGGDGDHAHAGTVENLWTQLARRWFAGALRIVEAA